MGQFSSTVRAFDDNKFINADGFECDAGGVPLAGGSSTITITTTGVSPEGVTSSPQGTFIYDSVSQQLWIKATPGTGITGYVQLI